MTIRTLMTTTAPFFANTADSGGAAPGGTPSPSSGGGSASTSGGGSAAAPPGGGGGSSPPGTGASDTGGGPPQGAEPSGTGGDFNFADIFGDDTGLSPEPAPQPQPGQQPPAQAPQTPAAAAPQPQPGVTQPPGQQPQPGAATRPEGAPGQPSPVFDPLDPQSLFQTMSDNEATMIDMLSKETFALSKEDAEALETDTIGTIPKLLARVFVQSQKNTMALLSRIGPAMVARGVEAQRRNAENEGKFYAAWPQLKKSDPAHALAVRQYSAVYRKMNPTATLDQAIKQVGPMVMMALGIQPGAAAPGAGNAGQPNGRVVGQPQPFVPAPQGAAEAIAGQQPGEWDWLGAEAD